MSENLLTQHEPITHPQAAACVTAAWDCQTHAFYGAPGKVAENLASLPESLIKRRVYMLMIQGEGRAEAHVFERFSLGDPEGTVASWKDDSLGDLVTRLTEVIVSNKGVHCPGEQVRATLDESHDFSVGSPEPAPLTASEAFGPVVAAFKDDSFIQATVLVLC
ncbi:hypothetical protein [Streptomyces sp. NPDC020965]|uniref:hypothetical protein n=1 Tax=Streptomyces sp. NPDC020965 TaxID=3365105 RepID=UPI0037963CFA